MKKYLIGIDEAGRGPLVGDMVVAGVMAEENAIEDLLERIEVRDSKTMTPRGRLESFLSLKNSNISFYIDYIQPAEIDRENLNLLTAGSIIRILRFFKTLLSNLDGKLVEIYVDEVKGVKKVVEKECSKLFWKQYRLVFESEADSKYPVVSLASIIAKVSRDLSISSNICVHGDFGSGYPSDSRTVEWLNRAYSSFEHPPPIVRKSWSILKYKAPGWFILKQRKPRTLWDFVGSKGLKNADKSPRRGES
ncbi:MAG: ribonuclease HII [Thermosphaera sp.]